MYEIRHNMHVYLTRLTLPYYVPYQVSTMSDSSWTISPSDHTSATAHESQLVSLLFLRGFARHEGNTDKAFALAYGRLHTTGNRVILAAVVNRLSLP